MALTVKTCGREGCSRPVGPRARYHSNACRQAAYRARRAHALAIMTRDLFEVAVESGTDEQREAYRALVEKIGDDFRTDNGAAIFRSALGRF